MNRIGIDQALHDIYESSNNVWRAISPAPFISYAMIDPEFPIEFTKNPEVFSPIFREDDFDAVTRVRRGRFYVPGQDRGRSQQWAIPHPVYGTLGSMNTQPNGWTERFLHVFDQYQKSDGPLPKLVALGSSDSIWRVIGCERIISDEYLFTLKARHGFGILPEVDIEAIPTKGREKAKETLETLADAAHRESPGSIVDRACDAAQLCLATWASSELNLEGTFKPNLNKLIQKIKNVNPAIDKRVFLNAAEIVRILHARGHSNAQERYGSRPIMEDDAEFALKAVGFILREFRWVEE